MGIKTAMAIAAARAGRFVAFPSSPSLCSDSEDVVDEWDSVDWANEVGGNEGGMQEEEQMDTRSSDFSGSRKWVSASAMGCAVCRYSR